MDSGEKPPLPCAATAATLTYAALPEFMDITGSGAMTLLLSSSKTEDMS
jgi:hypothetical protein